MNKQRITEEILKLLNGKTPYQVDEIINSVKSEINYMATYTFLQNPEVKK